MLRRGRSPWRWPGWSSLLNSTALGYPITPHMKKLFIKTYGCQMNAYDSGRMADLLAPLGYGATQAGRGRRIW